MNDTWGYKRSDKNWKPARVLIQMLSDLFLQAITGKA